MFQNQVEVKGNLQMSILPFNEKWELFAEYNTSVTMIVKILTDLI